MRELAWLARNAVKRHSTRRTSPMQWWLDFEEVVTGEEQPAPEAENDLIERFPKCAKQPDVEIRAD
jgi:hypothetical protein